MTERDDARAEAELARQYAERVRRVLLASVDLPEIDIRLALGAACPAGRWRERALWLAIIEPWETWIMTKPAARAEAFARVQDEAEARAIAAEG